ncbi:PEP-CTERM sorting domain-containing protein [Rivularia sp. UHCC 0363]|uniref:PEP-CTERM sorting domain-containing protein n=1 Tax=Rivularia sp. UHCC 0363 TaxID=3110244 RepID=UPI002B21C3A7|nr:PEP-CTERM sorting domain-containing protein [Rivularia sp. UHCC 0363]MEA5595535.1 PEP-CTERM sorting domain-containing protein [Rivularia sp. UHCC 0363]
MTITYKLSIVAIAQITTFITSVPSKVQAVTFISQNALQGNDQVDWSLGKVFNPRSPNPNDFLSNSFSVTSARNLGLQVDIPQVDGLTPPFVFQTLPPSEGVPTNFANGDFLLFTGFLPGTFPAPGNPGLLSITFDRPVSSAGSQIAVYETLNFTAFISAFDKHNNLLGTFSNPGTSSLALDNSAVFLGIQSDKANISRLVFSTSQPNRAFAINRLSIASVPEPSSILGLLGVLGMGVILKQNRK